VSQELTNATTSKSIKAVFIAPDIVFDYSITIIRGIRRL
jgi:hypothetical protein